MSLTEPVEIWTTWPQPMRIGRGYLVVGADSLPEFDCQYSLPTGRVRPATAPHTWYLTPPPGQEAGILLWAWRTIQEVQTRLAEAETQRASEECLHTEPDAIDAAKAWADANREEEA